LISALSLSAAPCTLTGGQATLDTFLVGGANFNCQLGDKQLNFSGLSGGITAATTNVDFTQGFGNSYNVRVSPITGTFTSLLGFTFNVAVDTVGFPLQRILQYTDQMLTNNVAVGTLATPNASVLTATHTVGDGPLPGVNPIILNGLTPGGQTAATTALSATSVSTAVSYDPSGNAGAPNFAPVGQAASFQFGIEQITVQAIPEPATLGLIGGGLLGLAAFARRRSQVSR